MKDAERHMVCMKQMKERKRELFVLQPTDRPTYKMDANDFLISSMANDLILRNRLLARFSLYEYAYVYVRRKEEMDDEWTRLNYL